MNETESRIREIVRDEVRRTLNPPPHEHDLRFAYLPTAPVRYPYTATVRCIAEGCPWTAHQHVTIASSKDLPKYTGTKFEGR